MGRGRAKAKQQKVARELKYSSHGTDLDALARELAGSAGYSSSTPQVDDDDDDDDTDDWVSATN
ncbi:DUF3073 domain-containing protein [Jatrophihabitans sp.]|uniref:DUF3073 domain-containing protein n=1 Tax=Jatrophihabitans sp. TaxID=1932789 RepID=UPI0030C6BBCF|nr:hypothetical protein [Jatrophihabitans sp.]